MEDEKQLLEELRIHFQEADKTLQKLTIRSVDVTLEIGTNKKTVKFPNTEFLGVTVTGSIQRTEEL